jgi:hypothetical protein
MKIPEFKPSRRFLGEYDIPCLVAEIKNSDVPGVATADTASTHKDRTFPVYIRVKEADRTSPWTKEKLEELLERDGLATAVAEGLKNLPSDIFDYKPEQQRLEIEANGYSPFVWIQSVVIDEVRKMVMIELDDISVLSEHGIFIYLKSGKWHFAQGEYFVAYTTAFEIYQIPEDTSAADEARRQFEEKWDALFPPVTDDAPFESDAPALYGVWNANKQATAEFLKKLGEIDNLGVVMSGKTSWWISPVAIEELALGYTVSSLFVSGCQRRGNWISLQVANQAGEKPWAQNYWCDGAQLVEHRGRRVYTRGSDDSRKGISMAELFKLKS